MADRNDLKINMIEEEGMTDRNTRDTLLRHAQDYVNDHGQEFDPTDPLCDVI